jgi:hypothetical protein
MNKKIISYKFKSIFYYFLNLMYNNLKFKIILCDFSKGKAFKEIKIHHIH